MTDSFTMLVDTDVPIGYGRGMPKAAPGRDLTELAASTRHFAPTNALSADAFAVNRFGSDASRLVRAWPLCNAAPRRTASCGCVAARARTSTWSRSRASAGGFTPPALQARFLIERLLSAQAIDRVPRASTTFT